MSQISQPFTLQREWPALTTHAHTHTHTPSLVLELDLLYEASGPVPPVCYTLQYKMKDYAELPTAKSNAEGDSTNRTQYVLLT